MAVTFVGNNIVCLQIVEVVCFSKHADRRKSKFKLFICIRISENNLKFNYYSKVLCTFYTSTLNCTERSKTLTEEKAYIKKVLIGGAAESDKVTNLNIEQIFLALDFFLI